MDQHDTGSKAIMGSVALFWLGYLVITLAVGFATSLFIPSEVWRLTAWGFIASVGLIALARFMARKSIQPTPGWFDAFRPASLGRFGFGFGLGVLSFGVHVAIMTTFAGPIRFEWVPEVGAALVILFFFRFLATSCMEELGFRGFTLQQLTDRLGVWPAVIITAVFFGLSHLSYGWSLQTIALGVIPGGLLWGMSAIATRNLAVPIGLHAAWNFAGWTSGTRKETGLLSVVVEDDAIARVQAVGTVSYWGVFMGLTLAFWWYHQRRSSHVPSASGPANPG